MIETPKLSRRDAIRFRRKRPTTITIPERVSPHVRLVFTEMRRQGVRYDDVEEGSGVRRACLKAWRHKNKPGLESIEAVLGFLGWDFVPIPRAEILSPALIADLAPIAERHGLTMAATIEALVELVAGIHTRFEAPPLAPSLDDLVEAPARGIGGTDAHATA